MAASSFQYLKKQWVDMGYEIIPWVALGMDIKNEYVEDKICRKKLV